MELKETHPVWSYKLEQWTNMTTVIFILGKSNPTLLVLNAKLPGLQALKTKVVHLSPGTSC